MHPRMHMCKHTCVHTHTYIAGKRQDAEIHCREMENQRPGIHQVMHREKWSFLNAQIKYKQIKNQKIKL